MPGLEAPNCPNTLHSKNCGFLRQILHSAGWIATDLDQLLAEILALHQARQRRWSVFKALNDIFAVPDSALFEPPGQTCKTLGIARAPVEDEHSLEGRSLYQEVAQVAGPHGLSGVVVLRNLPANSDVRTSLSFRELLVG